MPSPRTLLLPCVLLAIGTTDAASQASPTNTVNLRIETNISTLYEGPITSGPRNITVSSGDISLAGAPEYTLTCDGQGGLPDPPPPGNTPIDALDAAARARGFTHDGHISGEEEDIVIWRIATTSNYANETEDQYWGSLVNYQVSTFGWGLTFSGCTQQVRKGDEVLWAFITIPPANGSTPDPTVLFLKLTPTAVTVRKGKGTTVTVTDGRTGVVVPDASVAGVKTDTKGKATLYFFEQGFYQFKAHRTGDVRSNVMNIIVTN